MAIKRGKLITLEGIEGVGKTTAVALVRAHLIERGISVVCTREPGGTKIAEAIRHVLVSHHEEKVLPETELLLLFAARAQHVAEVIEPALARGEWVICDRFIDASYAYQGSGRGIPARMISQLEKWVHPKVKPKLTLLLDAPVSIALQRAKNRSEADRFEAERHAFFSRVRNGYLERAACYPGRFCIIPAQRTPAYVAQKIVQALNTYLFKD